uniref:Uncharacterized protein n=1 Tax=Anguilla anguilla TaxID=7936 RepID=A0A0E9WM14_ANGAN
MLCLEHIGEIIKTTLFDYFCESYIYLHTYICTHTHTCIHVHILFFCEEVVFNHRTKSFLFIFPVLGCFPGANRNALNIVELIQACPIKYHRGARMPSRIP